MALDKENVLVVDAEKGFAGDIEGYLKYFNLNMYRADMDEDAAYWLIKYSPFLVIFKSKIVNTATFQLLGEFRKFSDAAFILIADYTSEENRDIALRYYVDDVITQPYDKRVLIDKLRMHKRRIERANLEQDEATQLKDHRSSVSFKTDSIGTFGISDTGFNQNHEASHAVFKGVESRTFESEVPHINGDDGLDFLSALKRSEFLRSIKHNFTRTVNGIVYEYNARD
ncbi:hypothetical protein [Pleionea sp. CnH1-48]|uniref:hypothetical protein n=1 Tax=Pleionea sp. CnH1-48 TaxID=2954494 RepID=UPI0020982F91|nr:hypothetical protein [Pleionea sp. CnH1-48]MCO7224415.1 hypothetical protein [Pleionea sp. CnH1-48]